MSNDNIEDLLNSANEAIKLESYDLASTIYLNVLTLAPDNWEAKVYYSISSNLNVLYQQSETAMNTVASALSNISLNLKSYTNNPAYIKFYCADFCSLASKFALHICTINMEEFDRILANRTYYGRLSPIGFANNYLYPRNLRLSQMLYDFGDAIELQYSHVIDMDCVTNVWSTANFLLDTCIHNAGMFKKMEYRSKISEYKRKIRKYS